MNDRMYRMEYAPHDRPKSNSQFNRLPTTTIDNEFLDDFGEKKEMAIHGDVTRNGIEYCDQN